MRTRHSNAATHTHQPTYICVGIYISIRETPVYPPRRYVPISVFYLCRVLLLAFVSRISVFRFFSRSPQLSHFVSSTKLVSSSDDAVVWTFYLFTFFSLLLLETKRQNNKNKIERKNDSNSVDGWKIEYTRIEVAETTKTWNTTTAIIISALNDSYLQRTHTIRSIDCELNA